MSRTQFGYRLPVYNICRYLRRHVDLTAITLDHGRPRVHLDGVEVVSVPRGRNRVASLLRLVKAARRVGSGRYDVIYVEHFLGAGLLVPGMRGRVMVLDIRTGGVMPSPTQRFLFDHLTMVDAACYRHVCIISSSLARRLRIPPKKVHVVPVGAEPRPHARPYCAGGECRLLYVGTLTGRGLEETFRGLRRFLSSPGAKTAMCYDVVGAGFGSDREKLERVVGRLGLDDVVRFHGFVHYDQLSAYYERADIGVSYVPITPYYDVQPVTKTYDYLLAGIPVIATDTVENRLVVGDHNGVLVDDDWESFGKGLGTILSRIHDFSSEDIRSGCRAFSWENIVRKNLVPYLRAVQEGRWT